MARISIYHARHLCTAPRVIKEADALAKAGHEVSVHGCWWDPRLVERDRAVLLGRAWNFEPFTDGRPGHLIRNLNWWMHRARSRWAKECFKRIGRRLPELTGYGVNQMLQHARNHPTDLTIAHAEGSLWMAAQLRQESRKVGVDFEDWFSRDLPQSQHKNRPVEWLRNLEAEALENGQYLTTTSQAMAEAMHQTLGGNIPHAIYNTFKFTSPTVNEAQRRITTSPPRLHWFSQTIGPNRGLESLFTALPHVKNPWLLSLRGDDPNGFGLNLVNHLSSELRSRVTLEPTVPPGELPGELSRYDIGLALETDRIPSRDLTITNKIFQYLHAGLAIIASATAGHREVLQKASGVGLTFPPQDSYQLAAVIDQLLGNPEALRQARSCAIDAAENLFDHRNQEPIYAQLVEEALQS